MKQMSMATTGVEKHGRATRKAEFLAEMERLMPWAAICALIEPNYPKAGNGIHYCISNPLARGELRIAFDRLLTRLPNMRYNPDYLTPNFAPIFHIHGLDSLHLRF
jgi:cytochrome P450